MPGISSGDTTAGARIIDEIPLFFGNGLFGVVHRPQGPCLPGWTICSAFGQERTNSHRLCVEWARRLAATGHWALRFDYRGTGDSFGVFEDYSLHDYVEDIARANTELERISGMPCRGLIGLRLGAALAAVFAANSHQELELVMWEPIVNGCKYQDSLLRTAMANELANQRGAHRSRADFAQELAAGHTVLVDGYALATPMFESLATLDLAIIGRPTPAPVLVIQMTPRRDRPPNSAVSSLVKTYSAGGETRLDSVQTPPVWMRTKTYQWDLSNLFEKTLKWIAERKPKVPAPALDSPPNISVSGENGIAIERPVGFEVDGRRVWGVSHEPVEVKEDAPSIVMVAAGEACRSAFFYKRLARILANRGWRVLRFDPRGIGDSQGDLDCHLLVEVFSKVEGGGLVPDTLSALDFMEREYGSRTSVLMGLCGGAITSILSAEVDDRVIGIAPLELPMRLTPRGSTQESTSPFRVPWDVVFSQRRSTLFLLTVRRFFHLAKDHRRRLSVSLASTISGRSIHAPGNAGWYREKIGKDASVLVLSSLEKVLDRKIPVCCIFADTEQPRLFSLVLPGICDGNPEAETLLDFRVIQGSDHNFTMPGCSEKLIGALTTWVEDPRLPWVGT